MSSIQPTKFKVPNPAPQINFFAQLQKLKGEILFEALAKTLKTANIKSLDNELYKLVPHERLQTVRGYGLPGEMVFVTPYLLNANPRLLGYYRLLIGYSKKQFYSQGGFGVFATMEENGRISPRQHQLLRNLCDSMDEATWQLISGIGQKLTAESIRELTLLTLGPQLRGGHNVEIGADATEELFQTFQRTLAPYKPRVRDKIIRLTNAKGNEVVVEFGSDPDIRIYEITGLGMTQNLVAMEIKGGTDVSNLHNRLGEAEKSHLKAKGKGYRHFWTILRFKGFDLERARVESPTTEFFFDITEIGISASKQRDAFLKKLQSQLGLV